MNHSVFNINERTSDKYARMAMFVIFFWFGVLKLFLLSPADEIVQSLMSVTIPAIPFSAFFPFLGGLEMLIGILFLIPKWTKFALPILLVHMFTTFGPLLLVPEAVWQAPFVPTLEGQYIIKNLALVALALSIYVDAVHVKPSLQKK